MKLLTIVVPSFNVEKTLADTLDSLCLAQALDSIEILVVDDGSTDRTAEIAEQYGRRYPGCVHLIQKANGGHGSAVNSGIERAAGRYFRVVDGDDRLQKDGFLSLLETLAQTDADLVASNYKKVPVDGAPPLAMRFDGVAYGRVYPFSEIPLDGSVYFGIHSMNIRTSILKENGVRLQEHTFYVDAEYGILPMPHVKSVLFFEPYVYLYMVGNAGQSISPANFVKRYDDHNRVVTRMALFAQTCGKDAPQTDYIYAALAKLCFTNYMLAAFYDDDRQRGKRRARTFDAWLAENDSRLYRSLEKNIYIRFLRSTGFHILPRGAFVKTGIRQVYRFLKLHVFKKRKLTY